MVYFINYGTTKCLYKERHCKNSIKQEKILNLCRNEKYLSVNIYLHSKSMKKRNKLLKDNQQLQLQSKV